MQGLSINIAKEAFANSDFRRVLYTGRHTQLVLMSLLPGEEIGQEIHSENDQFFRVEAGSGVCRIDGNEYELVAGSAIVVPAGAEHNIVNTSEGDDLKLYTLYSPPHHRDGITRSTRELAMANEEEFDGVTSE